MPDCKYIFVPYIHLSLKTVRGIWAGILCQVFSQQILICFPKNNRNYGKKGYSPEYFKQFINLRVPREKWSLIYHLCKYASHWPNINWGRILTGSKQNFRSSVPQCYHLQTIAKFITQKKIIWCFYCPSTIIPLQKIYIF